MSSKGGGGFTSDTGVDPNAGIGAEISGIWHDMTIEPCPYTPADVQFNSVINPATAVVTYLWDFGDDTTSNAANPVHAYLYQATFNYTLTITYDGKQDYEFGSGPIVVNGGNHRPSINAASASPRKATVPNELITFTVTATDPDGDALTYLWDFGDGSPTETNSTATHIYNSDKYFPVTITVTDSKGASITKKIYAGMGNFPPEADTISWTPEEINTTTNITYAVNATDEENDVLSYVWDFGDGTKAYVANPPHLYTARNNYRISVTVTDPAGNSVVVNKIVSVTGET